MAEQLSWPIRRPDLILAILLVFTALEIADLVLALTIYVYWIWIIPVINGLFHNAINVDDDINSSSRGMSNY